MNELYDVLKASKASDFLIREEQTESREAFFIGQKLDMSRAKKVTHTFLTVFVDSEDGKFRGSAEKEIHQGISREEMKQEIDQALFAAQFVQNHGTLLQSHRMPRQAPTRLMLPAILPLNS